MAGVTFATQMGMTGSLLYEYAGVIHITRKSKNKARRDRITALRECEPAAAVKRLEEVRI